MRLVYHDIIICMKWKMAGVGILVISFLSLAVISPAYALKKRIRAPKVAGVVYSKAALARNTHSTVVTFTSYPNVKRFDYVLSYAANGIQQGVVGSFTPTGSGSQSRDLYFGTCSKGVCTPHYGITTASLTVTTTLTNGATYIKRFIFKNP